MIVLFRKYLATFFGLFYQQVEIVMFLEKDMNELHIKPSHAIELWRIYTSLHCSHSFLLYSDECQQFYISAANPETSDVDDHKPVCLQYVQNRISNANSNTNITLIAVTIYMISN